MEFLLQVLVVLFLIFLTIFIRHVFIRRSHPPGPLGFPFVGILPSKAVHILAPNLFDRQDKRLLEMRRKYGDMWSTQIWSQRVIFLATLEVMKEAFVDNAKVFSGRPQIESQKILSENCGIVFTEGELWDDNRKLAMRALRDLGLGKKVLEKHICDEGNDLIKYLESKTSIPIAASTVIMKAVSNVMARLTFNEFNRYDDPDFINYVEKLSHLVHTDVADNNLSIFPRFFHTRLARKLFPKVDEVLTCNQHCINFIIEKCKKKIATQDKNSDPDCVFDYFWRFRYDQSPTNEKSPEFTNIVHCMIDLYNAGIDTTNNLLVYCCLLLGRHKNLQLELRDEISAITDDVSMINMNMKAGCPKLQSFVDEVQRFCYLIPRVFHRAVEKCTLRGYEIIPDDVIIGDLATVTRDSTLYKNPDSFNPYRFMDKSKTKYVSSKSLIPFGIGKRMCLGEKIAMMEVFLFLSRLIFRFDISLSKETDDNLDTILAGGTGIIHVALENKMIFSLRGSGQK